MPKTAKEIADLIDSLQATYAATSLGLLLVNDPDAHRMLTAKGYDAGTTMRLGRKDNSYYEGIKFWESISSVQSNPQFNLNFLGSTYMTILSSVGHDLAENKYFDKTPELEFFRHLRNGISHGNQFNLINSEPRRPATFKNFVITPALQGQPVLFEYLSTGDVFDLLDHTKVYLRSLP